MVPPLRLSGDTPDSRSGDAADWQVGCDAMPALRCLVSDAVFFVILTADGDASIVGGPRASAKSLSRSLFAFGADARPVQRNRQPPTVRCKHNQAHVCWITAVLECLSGLLNIYHS